MIRLDNISVKRRGRLFVGPISHEMSANGLTVVLGPNGSGKTTLLRAMHGVERLSTGAVTYPEALSSQAFVFQTPIMLRRSVRENLQFPPALRTQFNTKTAIEAEVDRWLDVISLANTQHQLATRLSGGEKQKLALARALIAKPKLVFLDEPTSNLDGRSTREIEKILLDARSAGTRIILSTHDLGQARRLADDAIFLIAGKIHEYAEANVFFDTPQHPETKSFFAGDIIE